MGRINMTVGIIELDDNYGDMYIGKYLLMFHGKT